MLFNNLVGTIYLFVIWKSLWEKDGIKGIIAWLTYGSKMDSDIITSKFLVYSLVLLNLWWVKATIHLSFQCYSIIHISVSVGTSATLLLGAPAALQLPSSPPQLRVFASACVTFILIRGSQSPLNSFICSCTIPPDISLEMGSWYLSYCHVWLFQRLWGPRKSQLLLCVDSG